MGRNSVVGIATC